MIFSGAGSLSIYRRAVCSRLNVGGAGSRLGKLDLRKAPKSLTSRRLGARQLAISWRWGSSQGARFLSQGFLWAVAPLVAQPGPSPRAAADNLSSDKPQE
jgi:hypothetical protein